MGERNRLQVEGQHTRMLCDEKETRNKKTQFTDKTVSQRRW
jgi:hypothetical protein